MPAVKAFQEVFTSHLSFAFRNDILASSVGLLLTPSSLIGCPCGLMLGLLSKCLQSDPKRHRDTDQWLRLNRDNPPCVYLRRCWQSQFHAFL